MSSQELKKEGNLIAAFTRGPWFITGNTVYSTFFARGYGRNKWDCAIRGDSECSSEELRANALLIAAAPELYEVLEECLERLPYHEKTLFDTSGLVNRVGKALKKARGEA